LFRFSKVKDYLLIRVYRHEFHITDGKRIERVNFGSSGDFWSELDLALSDEKITDLDSESPEWLKIEAQIHDHNDIWANSFRQALNSFGSRYRRVAIVLSSAEALDINYFTDIDLPGIASLSDKDKIGLIKNNLEPVFQNRKQELHIKVVPVKDGAVRYISEISYLEFISELVAASGLDPLFIGYDNEINLHVASQSVPPGVSGSYFQIRAHGPRLWSGYWRDLTFVHYRQFAYTDIVEGVISEVEREKSLILAHQTNKHLSIDLCGFDHEIVDQVTARCRSIPDIEVMSQSGPTLLLEWQEVVKNYAVGHSLLSASFLRFPLLKRITWVLFFFTLIIFTWSGYKLFDKYIDFKSLSAQSIGLESSYSQTKELCYKNLGDNYKLFTESTDIESNFRDYSHSVAHYYPDVMYHGKARISSMSYHDGKLLISISFDRDSSLNLIQKDFSFIYKQLVKTYRIPHETKFTLNKMVAYAYSSHHIDLSYPYEPTQIKQIYKGEVDAKK